MSFNKNILSKLYTYFINRRRMKKAPNGWLVGDCPSCGREQKFGVSIQKNRTNCFVCGYNEKPFWVMLKLEGFSLYTEGVKFLSDVDSTEVSFDEKPLIEKQVKHIILPESFKNILFGDSFYSMLARRYVRRRGFNIDNVSLKGWGYCTKGNYAGYLIIPFYANNELIYFNARRIIESGPKFNNPDTENFNIGKNQIIYNLDALKLYNRVYIVESAMNAETLGNKALAIGGKSISQWQLSQFLKSQVKEFVIILDSDAKKEAIDQALKLVDHKKVKIVFMPEEKDVNDLGKIKTRRIIRKHDWLDFGKILKLKNQYNAKPEYSH